MQKIELGRKVMDLAFGKKVEGTVAAVLRNPDPASQRYVIRAGENLVDARVQSYYRLAALVPIYIPRPLLQPGDVFEARTLSARPWTDGQTI